MKAIVCLVLLATLVAGDVYLQDPRGSNDRLNEENTNRNNANRLFDSQNNAKGGYCVGPAMYYYEGSLLSVEWTNQHGCGENPKLYCNLVIQYSCTSKEAPALQRIRDGTTTDTIPDSVEGATATNNNGELTFGMHEPYALYQACKTRERNKGLWISDRGSEGNLDNPNRNTAIFTRQNNNGNRHGYECTEERDYYPYWHPTSWKDMAILTHDTDWCEYYQTESQNVKEKNYCATADGDPVLANNEAACTASGNQWNTQAAWNIDAPVCKKAPWSRMNHLGNTLGNMNSNVNLTLPTADDEECMQNNDCNCVLRLRYNISTWDLGEDGNNPNTNFIDYTKNGELSPIKNDQIKTQDELGHELALDTSQFGRTFQDRSHVFNLKRRPDGVSGNSRVFNLNVRGKRGNIVQTYPATEYDFTAPNLEIRVGDYVHFQWTGCDTNPAGNAGEGTDQTDRSNIVQIENLGASSPVSDKWIENNQDKVLFKDKKLRTHMAYIGQDLSTCLSYEELLDKNNNNQNNAEQDVQNCMKLNAAPTPYFDGGLIKMNDTGTYYFMSSRNNNFSNRDQKGEITVSNLLPGWAVGIVIAGSVLFVASAGVAGAMLYGKTHPHSQVANILNKF